MAISDATKRIDDLVATATKALAVLKLAAARGAWPDDLQRELRNASLPMTCVLSECREIRAILAADDMQGQATTATPEPLHLQAVPDDVRERRVASARRGVVPVVHAKPDKHTHTPYFDHMMAAAGEKPEEDTDGGETPHVVTYGGRGS